MRILALIALLFTSPLAAGERAPNHLLGEGSPYLLQHLYNSVDWYPWGEAAFAKARAEDKPIFLSVGYASCHWCRVMAEESFEDPEVGAFLNENFISIKMDREERPDLDEQFMLVTQTATGGGGWPNSVFLTPEGAPFYGGGYFPRDTFLEVLGELNRLWLEDSTSIEGTAQALGDVVREYLSRKARARPLTRELANAVAQRMLTQMDDFNGGFGVAPKFPQESRLLYLLDQAERNVDSALLEAVQLAATGMVNGGIHDQAGGGFHRYAVDNEWAEPHFEKMLYNQALISRLLTRLNGLQATPAYARAAMRTFDYVLRDMQASAGGFFASEDADSLNEAGEYVEGFYYTWTPERLRAATGDEADFLLNALNIAENGPFDGESTLRIIGDVADQTRLDAGLETLRLARMARTRPHIDQKILMGWNAEMIISLVAGAAAFDQPAYLAAAQKSARFIMKNMQNGEGYFRAYIAGAASIPAQLPDYTGFGRALVALHDADPEGGWLPEAQRIARYMRAHFLEENGVFRMKEIPEGLGPFVQMDDGEVPSGNAQAQWLLTALARRGVEVDFIQHAAALADALSGHALTFPEQRAAALAAVDAQNRGDTGPLRAVANGAVRVQARLNRAAGKVDFTIAVAEGWHINAHVPLEDYFIPTELQVNGTPLGAEAYPEPLVTTLAFNSTTPLALYDGALILSAPLAAGANEVVLVLQACSDEICLAPQELRFSYW